MNEVLRVNDRAKITEAVREKYGEAASRVASGEAASCGTAPSSSCCGGDPITSNLYESAQTAGLPQGAVRASLGCGNPTALAALTCSSPRNVSAPAAKPTASI